MKKKIYVLALSLTSLLCTVNAKAQSAQELYRFSNYDWSFGTARSAAMGGTFVSLGADLSSMMLNPAGLGMYRSSEAGITTSFTTLNSKSTFSDRGITKTNEHKNRLAINNAGAAFNVYRGSGSLTSVTLGLAYNKLVDFNSNADIAGFSTTSMSDYFSSMMNNSGISPNEIENNLKYGRNLGYSAGMLAYDAHIIDHIDNDGYVNYINSNAKPEFSQLIKTTGCIGQYDFSMGMNFSNKFYLGFGFGVQDIYYKEYNSYLETLHDNVSYDSHKEALHSFEYAQHLKQTGTAWNFKIGFIARPIEELRLAFAFHTPTYISIDEDYWQDAYGTVGPLNNLKDYSSSYDIYGPYNIQTPMRMMLGASYVFYNTAILSFDYERVWYDQMKLYSDGWDWENREVKDQVKSLYRPVNNFRVGLETQIAPNWFTRLGFAYYQGPYKNLNPRGDKYLFEDYDGRKLNYSGGFGYRTPYWALDLAYVYMDTKEPPTYIYDYAGGGMDSKPYRVQRQRHNVTLTGSWKF